MTPYVGQILMVGFNFAPPGWLVCDGSLQPISDNEVLYTLIGTTYGGDGMSTFGLPDLRGRTPIHQGGGGGLSVYSPGQMGGQENVTLTTPQMPGHTHLVAANSTNGTLSTPANNFFAAQPAPGIYGPPATMVTMGSSISPAGGGQAHDNLQPYLVINCIIATQGIYPSPQ